MRIPIVNEQDEIIGHKERYEKASGDINRVSRLFVFNEKGEFLVAKRQLVKKTEPDKWGPSVAGTVDEGYDYDSTVLKEAEEEIGLKNIKPIFYKKIFCENKQSRRFAGIYYVTINSKEVKFSLQKEEVSEVKWVSISELEDWFNKKPEDFVLSFFTTLANIKEIYAIKNKKTS